MLVVRHLSSPLPPGLLLLLHRAFARIAVVKPVTSRPASSERCARAENVSSDGVANETQNDDRRTKPRLSSDGVTNETQNDDRRTEPRLSSDGVANETQNDDRRTEPRLSSDGVCVWRARMGGAPGGLDARGW